MNQIPRNGRSNDETRHTDALFVCLLLLSLCLTRPSIFGQTYNSVGGAGIVVITLAFLLSRVRRRLLLAETGAEAAIVGASLIFWTYVFTSSTLAGNSNGILLLGSVVAGFCVPICFSLLASNGDVVQRTFGALARANSVLGYSIAITVCLLPFVGFAGLQLFKYTVAGYEEGNTTGAILFPFSIAYGHLEAYGLYRFCSIYRESGIAQAFFVWSFTYFLYSRARVFWVVGALLGAVLCGATAVVFSFAAVALVHFGARARWHPRQALLLIGVLCLMVMLLIYLPGIGLLDKLDTREESVSDRQDAMMAALPGSDILQWLLGRGFYLDSVENTKNAGVNAIASISSVGALGFCLYVSTFFAGLRGRPFFTEGYRYLALVAPFLITSLLFQPVMDAPLVMAMLFIRPPPKPDPARSAKVLLTATEAAALRTPWSTAGRR